MPLELNLNSPIPENEPKVIDLNITPDVSRTTEGIKERVTEAQMAGSEQPSEILSEIYELGDDESVNREVGGIRAFQDRERKKNLLENMAQTNDPDFQLVADGVLREPLQDFDKNSVSKEYGKKLATTVALSSVVLPELIDLDQETGLGVVDALEEGAVKASIVRNHIDQAVAKFQDKSLLGKAGSIGITLIPGLTWAARQNAVDNAPTSSILPGSNVREQIEYIWSLPPDELGPALAEAIEDVSTVSDFDGMLFAQAFLDYSKSEGFIDNMFGIVDIASVIPLTKLGKLSKSAASTLQRTTKAAIEYGPKGDKIANAVGDTGKAAADTIVKQGADIGAPKMDAESFESMLPSIMNVDDVFRDVKNVSNAATRKLREAAIHRGSIAMLAAKNGRAIDTLNDSERVFLAERALEDISNVHTNIGDSVLNIDRVSDVTPVSSTKHTMHVSHEGLTKDFDTVRSLKAEIERVQLEQTNRVKYLSDKNILKSRASERGISITEYEKLLKTNKKNNEGYLTKLLSVYDSDLTKAAEAAEKSRAKNIKFGNNPKEDTQKPKKYRIIKAEDDAINVDRIAIDFGNKQGGLFESEAAAKAWMGRYLQYKDAKVVPEGERFKVRVEKPLKQDEDLRLIELKSDQKTPDRAGDTFRHIRSAGYNQSLQGTKDSRTTSDISEYVGKLVEQVGKPIIDLGNKDARKVESVLDYIRNTVHPDGKRRWLNLDEFTEEFQRLNKELPSEQAVDAYVAARQINELDYVLKDLTMLKHKQRQGVEKWFVGGVEEGFEGVQRRSIPFESDDYFTIVAVDSSGKVVKKGTSKIQTKNQQWFKDKVDEGWTLVESYEGGVKYGAKVKGKQKRATFVLTQTPKRRQVRFGESLNYNPGGHIISKHGYYIKQGKVDVGTSGTRNFVGEDTIFNVSNPKEGEEILAHLEAARKLKQAGDEKGFKAYITDHLPEMTEDHWKRIDVDMPMGVVRSGQRLVDTKFYKQGVHFDNNLVNNKFNLSSQLDGRFVGRRDDEVVDALRSEQDSLVRMDKAELVRPFEAMQIGLRSSVDTKVMDEYIFKSVNTFLREFSDVIKADPAELRRNPIAFLGDPKFIQGNTEADKLAVRKAKQVADTINHFIGAPTPASKRLLAFKETISAQALERFGKNSEMTKFVDERLLHTVNDPSTYFRGLAFHLKMGLWNPKHLFLQSQIFTQIAAIGGVKDAFSVIPAYMYSYGLGLTRKPQMLEDAAARVAKIPGSGFTKEEFLESQRALDRSGWDIIGGSVSYKDLYEGPSITNGTIGKGLEQGTVFFKKGEHFGRVIAWHTAYKNWKKANPGKKLDRAGEEWISLRASDLTANMTRDMNATWQKGFLSVGTQFWGFQARVFEQMISPSSRLTKGERGRLFAGISTMYGVPVGLGAATQFVPVDDWVKQYLQETGMEEEFENSVVLETLRDGIMATGMEMLTGMDFDTSPFGPAGNPFFDDLLSGDKEWYEMIGGASASIIGEMVADLKPMVKGITDVVSLDNDSGNLFHINESELIDVFNFFQVASLDNTVKLYRALNTGRWMSKNDTMMADISLGEALISSVIGTTPEHVSDTFLKLESTKKVKDAVSGARRDIRVEFQRARTALDAGDEDAFKHHMKQARLIGIQFGLTPSQMQSAHQDGFLGETLEQKAAEKYNEIVVDHYKKMNKDN